MMFGHGSPTETREQIAEAQTAPREQCGVELAMFNTCIEKKDAEACAQLYSDVMVCKRQAEGLRSQTHPQTPAKDHTGSSWFHF
jgi:hypothetical protein